jgi:hypothetical protein
VSGVDDRAMLASRIGMLGGNVRSLISADEEGTKPAARQSKKEPTT